MTSDSTTGMRCLALVIGLTGVLAVTGATDPLQAQRAGDVADRSPTSRPSREAEPPAAPERQDADGRQANGSRISAVTWTPIGPAPIPNGETSPANPVSGRVSAIAVHPTNPNIVYVGAALGGVYRSLNGGTTWTPIFDTAQSLAIGAIAIAPSNPAIVYIGTGEADLTNDSLGGVGVYRIDNAETTADLTGPIDPAVTSGTVTANPFSGRSISRILVHPTDPATIFVSTATAMAGNPPTANTGGLLGLYRSTNADAALASIAFTKLAVTTAGGLDVPSTGHRSILDMVFEPGTPDTLLCWVSGLAAAGDGGVYRSTNALAAAPVFVQTLTTATDNARGELAIRAVAGVTTVYAATGETSATPACAAAGDQGRVRRSIDGGVTWPTALPTGEGFCGARCASDIAVALDPTAGAGTLHVGGSQNGVCSAIQKRAADGFTLATNHAGLHARTYAIAVAPSNPAIVYAGNGGGIFKSIDAGATWTSLNSSTFNATLFQSLALHPNDPQFMIGGTDGNGTVCLGTCGANANPAAWTRADAGDGGYTRIDLNAATTTSVTMYHTYANVPNVRVGFARVTKSACATDGEWVFRGFGGADASVGCEGVPRGAPNGITGSDNSLTYPPLELGPGNPNTVYFGTDRLYRSNDRGDTMNLVSQAPIVPGAVITSIAISPSNDNIRLVGMSDGSVWRTGTGSSVLVQVGGFGPPSGKPVSRIVFGPGSTVWLTYGGYGIINNARIWRSTNAGVSFTSRGVGIPDVSVNALAPDLQNAFYVYAATDAGVFRLVDNGFETWQPFNAGLPRVAVFDLAIENKFRVLRAATHGRGVWEMSLLPPVRVSGTKAVSGLLYPNGALTYTIVLTNSGADAQLDNPGHEFSDVLPSQLTLDSASATSGAAVATPATNTVTWNGSIAAGGSVTITIHATIKPNTANMVVSNRGDITYDSDANGTNEFPNLTDNPATPGSDATRFTVGVVPVASNSSTTTFEDVPVIGTFDATNGNTKPLTYSLVTSGTRGTVDVNPSAGRFTYTPGLNQTGTDTFTFKASDGTVDSNVATITVTIVPATQISATKIATGSRPDPTVFFPGDAMTYSIVLFNAGQGAQADNPGHEFSDVLPAALTLVSASASAGTAVATAATNTVTWNGAIAANGTVVITIQATVKPASGTALVTNQGAISYDLDRNGTNEAVALTDDPATPGADATTFTVRVAGPTVTITSPAPPSATSTSPFIALMGTTTPAGDAASDGPRAGVVTSVTWTSNRGFSGTATGTATWRAEVPLVGGANVITATATDAGGLTGTATITISVTSFVYYLAEGATGLFFDLELSIANPNLVDAPVSILYLKEDGTTVTQTLTVLAQRSQRILVDALAGLDNTAVSSVITSTAALPLAVERTMTWDATGYGAHTEKATAGARTQWFFAEGSQGFFDTYLLLANPQTTASTATVTFLVEGGAPVVKTYALSPTSRTNVYAGAIPELVGRSFGMTVVFTQPGVAERAMYFGSTPGRLWNGGHESAGVNEASTSWFLAEGATGPFFDTYILLSNPTASGVVATLTFLLDTGGTLTRTVTVPANGRATVNLEDVPGMPSPAAVATKVEAPVPILAERAMYWAGAFSSWYEAHNAFGVTNTGTTWALAEGRVGGPASYETYILLANPGTTAATVTVTYLRESAAPIVKTYTVPPTSRVNVVAASDGLASESFGALITSTQPIAVERALYASVGGVFWAAGTNATATRIP